MGQPGKVANPARGQLNRENEFLLFPHAPEKLVSRDSCSLSVLKLNLVLTHEIPPDFHPASVFLFQRPYDIGPVPS